MSRNAIDRLMDDNRCQWKKNWPEECQLNVAKLLYHAMLQKDSNSMDKNELDKFCQAMERITFVSADTLEDYMANIACMLEGKCFQRLGPEEKAYLKGVTEEILRKMSPVLSRQQQVPVAPSAGNEEPAAVASTSGAAIPDLDLTDIPDFVNSAPSLDDIEMTLDSIPDALHFLDD